jgi:hypothetical protein
MHGIQLGWDVSLGLVLHVDRLEDVHGLVKSYPAHVQIPWEQVTADIQSRQKLLMRFAELYRIDVHQARRWAWSALGVQHGSFFQAEIPGNHNHDRHAHVQDLGCVLKGLDEDIEGVIGVIHHVSHFSQENADLTSRRSARSFVRLRYLRTCAPFLARTGTCCDLD